MNMHVCLHVRLRECLCVCVCFACGCGRLCLLQPRDFLEVRGITYRCVAFYDDEWFDVRIHVCWLKFMQALTRIHVCWLKFMQALTLSLDF